MNPRGMRILLVVTCLLLGALHPMAQDSLQLRFMQAVEESDYQAVKTLIAQGADVNMSIVARTPNYQFLISRELFLNGVKARHGEGVYVSPIHANAITADLKVLKMLRKKRVNIESGDSDGKTALMYALRNPGGEDYALQLLKRGANYRSIDLVGNTVMHYAAYGGNIEGLRMTAGGGVDINARNADGITPLLAASVFSGVAVLQEIVSLGGDIQARDSAGMHALHYAAAFADSTRLAWILPQVDEALLPAANGYTPLDIARLYGNEQAVAYLSGKGCKYSAYRHEELLAALKAADHQALRRILADGADPNHKDDEYPLILAIHAGDNVATEMLLAAGANADVSSAKGAPALQIAVERDHPIIAMALLKAGAPAYPTALCACIDHSDKAEQAGYGYWDDLARVLATKVADINAPCARLKAPALHYAAYLGREGLVTALLQAGSNPNARDHDGWTALHWTAMKRDNLRLHLERLRMAEALLAAGTNINSASNAPKNLPHTDPQLALRVPAGATAFDILGYALPLDADLLELLQSKGGRTGLAASAYLDNGRVLFEKKHYVHALREFTKAVETDPKLPEAYFYRAQSSALDKHYEDAERDLNQAIVLRSGYAEAFASRAKVRYELGKLEMAEKDLTSAMALGYGKAESLYWRGRVRMRLGRREEGCQDLHQAAALGNNEAIGAINLYCKAEK